MRVTSKGQVTIPKPVRDQLGIRPGDQVAFESDEDGRVYVIKQDDYDSRLALLESMGDRLEPGWTTERIMSLTRGEDWADRAVEPSGKPDITKLDRLVDEHERQHGSR